MPDHNWRFDAKCWGQTDNWDIKSLGNGNRDAKAKKKCAGCRSLIECAQMAYDNPETVGVIAAGIAFSGDTLTPDSIRHRLAELLDVPFISARNAKTAQMKEASVRHIPCTKCGYPTISQTAYRNRAAPEGVRPRHVDGLCSACWRKRLREDVKHRALLA